MYAPPAPSSSGEDLSQYQEGGDQDGSLSAPSEEYEELDPLEKEWMLACASGDMQTVLNIIMRDDTLINRKDFLHGYTALHWAAKLGRCDIMSALIINGAFPNIKSVSWLLQSYQSCTLCTQHVVYCGFAVMFSYFPCHMLVIVHDLSDLLTSALFPYLAGIPGGFSTFLLQLRMEGSLPYIWHVREATTMPSLCWLGTKGLMLISETIVVLSR
jgi:hypothetical protein